MVRQCDVAQTTVAQQYVKPLGNNIGNQDSVWTPLDACTSHGLTAPSFFQSFIKLLTLYSPTPFYSAIVKYTSVCSSIPCVGLKYPLKLPKPCPQEKWKKPNGRYTLVILLLILSSSLDWCWYSFCDGRTQLFHILMKFFIVHDILPWLP